MFHQAIDFLYPALIDKKMAENPEYLIDNFPPIVIDAMDVDSKLVGKDFEDIGRAVIHLKESCCRFIRGGDENQEVLYKTKKCDAIS